jgi:hypothetical protein
LEETGVDARRILYWILKKQDGRVWTGLNWLRVGTKRQALVNSHETSGSIKCRKFLVE